MKKHLLIGTVLILTIFGVLIGTNKTFASGVQALATLFVGTTPIVGGMNGDCLTINTAKLGSVACGGSATTITVGVTAVSGGTTNQFLYNNGGTLGNLALFATNAQTGTYQVLASDFIACKTIPVASGTFTITLVASGSQPTTGQCVDVVNYGSGVVTIARSGQNINGGTMSLTLNAGSATGPSWSHVVSDGTNYEASVVNPSVATSFTPPTILHYGGQRGPAATTLTNFSSGNVVVVILDGEGATVTQPTIAWSDGTGASCNLAANGLIGGTNNITTYVCILASSAPVATPTFAVGQTFTGSMYLEFPISLVQGVIDASVSLRNCCTFAGPAIPLSITTTVPDVIIMGITYDNNADFNLCPPNAFGAARFAAGASGSAQACFIYAPSATTSLPVNPLYVSDATNAVQVVALKHQ